MTDNVNHPNHYTVGGIEVIDYIKAKLTPEQFEGYLLGNVIKYVSRHGHKNGLEDLRKAQWCLNKVVEEAELSEFIEAVRPKTEPGEIEKPEKNTLEIQGGYFVGIERKPNESDSEYKQRMEDWLKEWKSVFESIGKSDTPKSRGTRTRNAKHGDPLA